MSKQELRVFIRNQWNQCLNLDAILHIAWRRNSVPAVERWIIAKAQKEHEKFEQMKKAAAGGADGFTEGDLQKSF
jgi:hypothetical protein